MFFAVIPNFNYHWITGTGNKITTTHVIAPDPPLAEIAPSGNQTK